MNGKFMICHDLFISCMLQQFLLLYNCTIGSISLINCMYIFRIKTIFRSQGCHGQFLAGTVAASLAVCRHRYLLLFFKIQAKPLPCQPWWGPSFWLDVKKLLFKCCSEQEVVLCLSIRKAGNFTIYWHTRTYRGMENFLVHNNPFPIKGDRLYLTFR